VLFSESKMLEEKDYSIEDFEQLAHEVAAKCELGYEKTDVKVTFDSGTIFNIDLSLGRGCDKSIKERLGKLKSYVEEFKERLTREELLEFGFLTKVDLEDIDNSKNKALYSSIIAEEAKRKEEEEKK
ncbi:LPD25 domain-containing protein, partial [Vibrio parahaemolyticus]